MESYNEFGGPRHVRHARRGQELQRHIMHDMHAHAQGRLVHRQQFVVMIVAPTHIDDFAAFILDLMVRNE
jgi:hypothetical protein